jgi:hypothetical protein
MGIEDIIRCKKSLVALLQDMRSYWTPMWSSGQSSWLQIQRFGFDSRRYQIFWEVVGLERGPLSFGSTIEELLGRKSSGSGLEIRDYGFRGSAALTTRQPLPEKVGPNFTDKRRSLRRYSSLEDSGHWVFLCGFIVSKPPDHPFQRSPCES